MVYLSTFKIADDKLTDPYIYPHNVFMKKEYRLLVFGTITVLYGENGSGKSTLLNLIANKLELSGKEHTKCFGIRDFWGEFLDHCTYGYGETDSGKIIRRLPPDSCYIKSEDILYEIKKIQQESVLKDGYRYYLVDEKHMPKDAMEKFIESEKGWTELEKIKFAQEKYSNGETSIQILVDRISPTGLYLIDEPEVSLSPQNQIRLAEEINRCARFFDSQFIIASHSPFFLGTLNSIIYNLDTPSLEQADWKELPAMKAYKNFFDSKW